MKKLLRKKNVTAALLVAAGIVPNLFYSPVHAQSANDANKKLNLWIDAQKAKGAGDLATAKSNLEQILKLDPSATEAREELAEVIGAIATKNGTAPAAMPVADTPLAQAAAQQEALYLEVEAAMREALQEASNGNTGRALQLVDGATAALPDNVGAQVYKDRLSLLRQQIITARDSGVGFTAAEREASILIIEKVAEMRRAAVEARKLTDEARTQIKRGQLDAAQATLDKATTILPRTTATQVTYDEIRKVQSILLATHIQRSLEARDISGAERYLADYGRLNTEQDKGYFQLKSEVETRKADPRYRPIETVSPGFTAHDAKIQEQISRGKAQYFYGDYEGALASFRGAMQLQPDNAEAKNFIVRINSILSSSGAWNRTVTKTDMLNMVDASWMFPHVYSQGEVGTENLVDDAIQERLKKIIIPTITLRDAPLARAIETLSELSVSYDPAGKGVNMMTFDPENKNPTVSISMRDVPLDRVLDFVVRFAGFEYSVNQGIIEVRANSGTGDVETEFFPVSMAAVLKMTGIKTGSSSDSGSGTIWGSGGSSGVSSGDERQEEGAIKSFLQRSGIGFDSVPGSNLSYDGTQLIVTQSRRNLEKIKNILRRYSDIKQVHIEAKFIEVSEGALNQLSTNWIVSKPNALGNLDIRAQTNLRTLDNAFGASGVANPGIIKVSGGSDPTTGVVTIADTQTIPNTPPAFNVGYTGPANPTFRGVVGSIGSWDLELIVHAIQANEGSDLMAAPSITVLDGKTATIRIAQLLRYPESYNDIQSNVGTSGGGYNSSGSGASVTITAGTPQDFTVQEIGVKLEVTPTVADDDAITLHLHPSVTEFEGFVEYGGTSVAIAGSTTVTVPSGFFQPVFSVREVDTDVVIFDGATAVLGGLTREEVKTVNDKVPVLGDLPLIGNLFRSNGKMTSKKNLMIFVTANLVSPGGGPLRSNVGPVRAGSTFANPSLVTPGGSVSRQLKESAEKNVAPAAN